MEDLICKVKLNGNSFFAQINYEFGYSEFAYNTDVNEDVVKQTAQQIYDAVKKEDYKNTRYAVRITADFKDNYLKDCIDADYSDDFIPVSDNDFYIRNDYDFPYGIEDAQVEYDKDEVESEILSLYAKYFYDVNDDDYYGFDYQVRKKLYEIGFDKLCKEKGIEVEIEYANIKNISVSYDGESFLFRTYVILNAYDRDDDE